MVRKSINGSNGNSKSNFSSSSWGNANNKGYRTIAIVRVRAPVLVPAVALILVRLIEIVLLLILVLVFVIVFVLVSY